MAGPSLPIYQRPRTPSLPPANTPPYSTPERAQGLGLQAYDSPIIRTHFDYDIQHGISDSPTKQTESGRTDSASTHLSPAFSINGGGLSPNGSLYTPITPQTGSTDGGSFQHLEPGVENPFNFTTTQYLSGKGKAADALGKRKGHKYRHSSMHAAAMDSIIQQPVMRTPLAVPALLPIPTRKEIWRSVTSNQRLRLAWCVCHFVIAGYVQFIGMGSLALTALSRLLIFDAAGATLSMLVDVMSNFEVWKRSSIKHPFGLQRVDVLAGFGMAVFISFMGLDIISHGTEHALENVGTHEAHTSHHHDRVPASTVHAVSLLAIITTLVSAVLLKNHKRIGKATKLPFLAAGGRILGNPSHVLTLSCSVLILILPSINAEIYTVFDFMFSVLIALLMVSFGLRLGMSLASMLLMSYPKSSRDKTAVRDVIHDIETDPSVSGVEEARFWQVHYGLCMANLKLRYRGGEDEMVRLRQRVTSLIRQRLGGTGATGGKWEISLQMAVERD